MIIVHVQYMSCERMTTCSVIKMHVFMGSRKDSVLSARYDMIYSKCLWNDIHVVYIYIARLDFKWMGAILITEKAVCIPTHPLSCAEGDNVIEISIGLAMNVDCGGSPKRHTCLRRTLDREHDRRAFCIQGGGGGGRGRGRRGKREGRWGRGGGGERGRGGGGRGKEGGGGWERRRERWGKREGRRRKREGRWGRGGGGERGRGRRGKREGEVGKEGGEVVIANVYIYTKSVTML